MTDLNTIKASIISSIRPSDEERNRLKTLAERIIERINSIGKAKT